jgi:hypothetical protein
MILCAVVTWTGPWLLSLSLSNEPEPGICWPVAFGWLAVKLLIASGALFLSWRRGYITWKFPAGLILGWLSLTGFLIWGMPTWQSGGAERAITIVLLLPLARLALCPLAIAANRHR